MILRTANEQKIEEELPEEDGVEDGEEGFYEDAQGAEIEVVEVEEDGDPGAGEEKLGDHEVPSAEAQEVSKPLIIRRRVFSFRLRLTDYLASTINWMLSADDWRLLPASRIARKTSLAL